MFIYLFTGLELASQLDSCGAGTSWVVSYFWEIYLIFVGGGVGLGAAEPPPIDRCKIQSSICVSIICFCKSNFSN